MDSHQHAQQRLQELYTQAEIARALRPLKPRWYRRVAQYLVRLARQMDRETVVLEAARQ
ncbi:hypothetical protein [Deinococcus roseus]|uniref:Uncharacterized protein n=1 Tax=Deinococcus roseus TaxID=392414 RepID=A0ABQ2CVP9_9DEIO|nr:hypothetical protein [Deinococcus roseus]GGJ25475.1 hypothetical protein GCM10008938_09470 [Deinococcus roseus]